MHMRSGAPAGSYSTVWSTHIWNQDRCVHFTGYICRPYLTKAIETKTKPIHSSGDEHKERSVTCFHV